jgi:hypothetical protein
MKGNIILDALIVVNLPYFISSYTCFLGRNLYPWLYSKDPSLLEKYVRY